MFFRFPRDARWNAERSAVEFSVGVASMKAWCGFLGACSQMLLREAPRLNDASKPTIYTEPGLNSSPSGRLGLQAVDRRWQCRDHRT